MAHEQMSARLGGVAYDPGVETTPTISAHTATLAAACAQFHQPEPDTAHETVLESHERWHERHAHGHYERMGWGGLRDAAAREEVASRLGVTAALVAQAVSIEANYFLREAGALVEREECAHVMPLLEALVHYANAGANSCLWGMLCWASGEHLRERAGEVSTSTYFRHLAKLQELGLVVVLQHAGNHSVKLLTMPWCAQLGLDAPTQLEHLAHLGQWCSPERIEAVMAELRALDTLNSPAARQLMGRLLRDGAHGEARRSDLAVELVLEHTRAALEGLSHRVRDEARALDLHNTPRTPETPPRPRQPLDPPTHARSSAEEAEVTTTTDTAGRCRGTVPWDALRREPHGCKDNRTNSEAALPLQINQADVLRPPLPTSQETPTVVPPPARVRRRKRVGTPAHVRPKQDRRKEHVCDRDRANPQPWWAAHSEQLSGRGMEQMVRELRGMLTGEHEHYPQLIRLKDTVVQGRLMRGEMLARQQDVPRAQVRATVALITADLSTTHPDCHSLSAWLTGRLKSYLGRIVYQNPATLLHALRADAQRTAQDLQQQRQPVAPAARVEPAPRVESPAARIEPAPRPEQPAPSPAKTSRDKWSDPSYGAPKGLDPRLVGLARLRELRALVMMSCLDEGVEPDAALLLSMEHTLGHDSLYQGQSKYTLGDLIRALVAEHAHPDALLRALLKLWTRAATQDPDDTPPMRLARMMALHTGTPEHTASSRPNPSPAPSPARRATPTPPRRDVTSPQMRQAPPHRQDACAVISTSTSTASTERMDAHTDADAAWSELVQCIECAGWPARLGAEPDERELRAHIKPGWWRACPPGTSLAMWLSFDVLPKLRHTRSRAAAFTSLSALSHDDGG